jgi:hypothetical protein
VRARNSPASPHLIPRRCCASGAVHLQEFTLSAMTSKDLCAINLKSATTPPKGTYFSNEPVTQTARRITPFSGFEMAPQRLRPSKSLEELTTLRASCLSKDLLGGKGQPVYESSAVNSQAEQKSLPRSWTLTARVQPTGSTTALQPGGKFMLRYPRIDDGRMVQTGASGMAK